MATYAQTPGLLNIKGVVGTHFSCQLDFDTSLTGYTFDSGIVLQEYPTKREQAITVTVNNAAQGVITLSLTENQTTTVGKISGKKWYLNWAVGGNKQTILAGIFELSDIPLGQNAVTSTGVTINTQNVDITLSAFSNAALDAKLDKSSVSAFGLTLIDDANAATARTTLGLGSMALESSSSYQPINTNLTQISAVNAQDNDFLQKKTGSWTSRTIAEVKSDFGITNVDNTSDLNKPISTATQAALNYKVNTNQISTFGYSLVDDATASDARTTLGLGSISTQNANSVAITGGSITGITDVTLADGGTGASLTGVAGGIVYSKASEFAITSVGASGQVLTSAGSGQPIWTDPSSLPLTSASNVNVVDDNSTNAPYYPIFVPATGNTQPVTASSTKLNFNPSTGTLSATTFSGNLTGNVTGNLTGNVTGNLTGNITGSASTAVINNDNSTNREYFPVFAYQSAGTATTLYGSSTKLKFNPSNGYFTADGGVFANNGDLGIYSSGVHWANGLVFDAETNSIFPNNSGVAVASWTSANGMYVTGTASKDVPLRLMDGNAANLATGAYIIVRPSASATTNGTELRNAYAAAKAFTPNTAALSATNRATVILLPGRYDLGTTRLNLDTDFVDIIGLTDTPEQVVITSSITLSDSGTIYQTANDVKIKGVTIDRTGAPAGSGAGRTAAYFPFPKATAITTWSGDGTTMTIAANGHGLQTGDSVRISGSGNSSVDGAFTVTRIDDNSFSYPSTVNASGSIGTATERFNLTYIENCVFSGTSDSGMRIGMEYSGTYRKCVGGASSFGGTLLGNPATTAIASGLFEDCTAGAESFGGNGTASGTFTRCASSGSGFGGTASGTFTDCSSVTGFTFPSGTFVRCSVATSGFGNAFGGSATGTFTDCTINNSAYNGTFTGTARRCRFVASGGSALSVGNNAKLFDSTLVSSGVNNSITAGSAVTISLAGCRMNNSINANVSNNLGTLTESYNLIDSDIN